MAWLRKKLAAVTQPDTNRRPVTATGGVRTSLDSLLALRRVGKQLDLHTSRKVVTQQQHLYVSLLRGRGMDFDEVRPYHAGDDMRYIDWRVTARTGAPHTKLFCEEKERPVLLLIDYGANMFFGTKKAFKSVIAAQVAACFGWSAISNGDRLGGILMTNEELIEFRPRSREHAVLPILHSLSHYQPPYLSSSKPNALAKAFRHLRQVAKPGSMIIVISDFSTLDDEATRHLQACAEHNDLIACQVYDKLQESLPTPNDYVLSDGHQTVVINTKSQKLCQQYHRDFIKAQQQLERTLHKSQTPLIKIATDDDVKNSLIRYFAKKK